MLQTVFWDFNGTLLNDVQMVVDINNRVFTRHGIPRFLTVDDYRRAFKFPIRAYYRDLGVSDALFDTVAHEWMHAYTEEMHLCALREGAAQAAARLRAAGLNQAVISASMMETLHRQLSFYPELEGLFDAALGLDNIYAESKVHLAQEYCHALQIDTCAAVFIGDTAHDAQTAEAIGCRCILVTGGHQMPETLRATGVPVVDSFDEVCAAVLSM